MWKLVLNDNYKICQTHCPYMKIWRIWRKELMILKDALAGRPATVLLYSISYKGCIDPDDIWSDRDSNSQSPRFELIRVESRESKPAHWTLYTGHPPSSRGQHCRPGPGPGPGPGPRTRRHVSRCTTTALSLAYAGIDRSLDRIPDCIQNFTTEFRSHRIFRIFIILCLFRSV